MNKQDILNWLREYKSTLLKEMRAYQRDSKADRPNLAQGHFNNVNAILKDLAEIAAATELSEEEAAK